MAFVLVARMTAKDGEQDRVAELIDAARRGVAAPSPGNVHYIAHRDPEDPRVFLMYEQYRDKAAFEEHGQTEHFQTLGVGADLPAHGEPRAELLRDVRVAVGVARSGLVALAELLSKRMLERIRVVVVAPDR